MTTQEISSIYRPIPDGGRFLLYAGGVIPPGGGAPVDGQVELELNPGVELRVHLLGPGSIAGRVNADADGHLRLLLKWAGIPTAVPSSLPLLAAHLKAQGQPGWEGPEILFNIRNAMVHPPKRLADPEWPDAKLLFEAWQLGTWYLELALLRVLKYQGQYWSRIRLNRPGADGEPVPWST